MKKILFIFYICCMAFSAFSQDDLYYTGDEATVEVKAQIAPPALPVYEQPPCPYEGYMWTPGYWAWAPAGYYWVPGVWVAPPRVGFLWTPGYWGFYSGYYGWHQGYWGEHVGYYGGVCYGFGYGGSGFYGGRWEGGGFRYNTAVWHVNTTVIHNTYVSNEGYHPNESRASFNGAGGAQGRPNSSEQQAMHENHVPATTAQQSHQAAASNDHRQFASANHGRPSTAAMNAPGGRKFGASKTPTANGGRGVLPANNVNNNGKNVKHSGPNQPSNNANRAGQGGFGSHGPSQPAGHNVQQNGNAQQRNYQQHNNPQQHSNMQSHGNVQQHSSGQRPAPTRTQSRPQTHSAPSHSSGGGGHRGK